MAQTESLPVIVEGIDINAPIRAVFAALSEPDQIVQWWGSEGGYHTTEMVTDLRVGGAWKTSGLSADGEANTVFGVYRVVDPPRCLEFTWRYRWADGDDASHDTIVRYDLEERNGVTRITVTHTGFTSVDDRNDHEKGWKVVLGWLAAYVVQPA